MPTITRPALLLVDDYVLASTITAASELSGFEATFAEFPRQDSAWMPATFQTSRAIVLDLGEARTFNTVACRGLEVAGTGLTPELVSWQVETADDSGFSTNNVDWGSQLYVIRQTGAAVIRAGMPQPNLGPTDSQLVATMNAGRLDSIHRRDAGSEVLKRYVRVTFSHSATGNADQTLRVPKIFIGFPDMTVSYSEAKLDVIVRGPGETLRAWNLTIGRIVEDEYQRKVMASMVPGKRAFLALDVDDRPEFALSSGTGGDGRMSMVEVVSADFTESGFGFKATGAPAVDGFAIGGSIRVVERRNGESEQ